jgi:alpha-beta hydrolase superfamily lysophospholipase
MTMMTIKTKSEKSKWFYSDYKNDTTAVVIVAHGLNLLPSKMDQIASFLASKKCDVLRISLGKNPDLWTSKFSDFYDEALEHSEILQRPLYFLGFSLGGLLGVHYIVNHPHLHKFCKCILMAPATHTKFYTIIPALLSYVFPKGSLPSLNLKTYRERSKTSLSEYKKMWKLQK